MNHKNAYLDQFMKIVKPPDANKNKNIYVAERFRYYSTVFTPNLLLAGLALGVSIGSRNF
jgi:hypothetical protein